MKHAIPVLFVAVFVSATVFGEGPTPLRADRPTLVSFLSTENNANINARYELRFVPTPGCPDVAPMDLGSPAPDAAGAINVVMPNLASMLPTNCVYTGTVAALASGAEALSDPSESFVRGAIEPMPCSSALVTTTITGYPSLAKLGEAFPVQTKSTGPTKLISVWLDDSPDSRSSGDANPAGALNGATLLLMPHVAGIWHLWASARDGNGCDASTGLVRSVTVR